MTPPQLDQLNLFSELEKPFYLHCYDGTTGTYITSVEVENGEGGRWDIAEKWTYLAWKDWQRKNATGH